MKMKSLSPRRATAHLLRTTGCTTDTSWVDGEKMSKSLNNFFTVRDIRKEYDGDFIRFFLLSVQYRGPINFSDEV